jgi:hypothetical protein
MAFSPNGAWLAVLSQDAGAIDLFDSTRVSGDAPHRGRAQRRS